MIDKNKSVLQLWLLCILHHHPSSKCTSIVLWKLWKLSWRTLYLCIKSRLDTAFEWESVIHNVAFIQLKLIAHIYFSPYLLFSVYCALFSLFFSALKYHVPLIVFVSPCKLYWEFFNFRKLNLQGTWWPSSKWTHQFQVWRK